MASLHNRVNRKELREKMRNSTEERMTISFYRYAKIDNPQAFRDDLYRQWEKLGVMGRTYVAYEGINAQISLPKANFEQFRTELYQISFLNGCRLNIAIDDDGKSFFKLTIKLREQIVSDGIEDPSFNPANTGVHLNAKDFNEKLEADNIILVDMRNFYESEVGHFKGAITPEVENFRESLPIIADMLAENKDKTMLMYCTGGIRCEKASAYMKHRGFENVFQLEGGIIEYTRQCRNLGVPNKFLGKNFVFDERLSERISDDIIAKCHQCGTTCDTHHNCSNVACNTLFIQCPECAAKYEGTCSTECQEIIHLPAEQFEEIKRHPKEGKNKRIFARKMA